MTKIQASPVPHLTRMGVTIGAYVGALYQVPGTWFAFQALVWGHLVLSIMVVLACTDTNIVKLWQARGCKPTPRTPKWSRALEWMYAMLLAFSLLAAGDHLLLALAIMAPRMLAGVLYSKTVKAERAALAKEIHRA